MGVAFSGIIGGRHLPDGCLPAATAGARLCGFRALDGVISFGITCAIALVGMTVGAIWATTSRHSILVAATGAALAMYALRRRGSWIVLL